MPDHLCKFETNPQDNKPDDCEANFITIATVVKLVAKKLFSQ
jgi:hypothetical protein